MRSPSRSRPAQPSGASEPLEAVQAFIARLGAFRDAEGDEMLRGHYADALACLEALAQRLKEAETIPRDAMGAPAAEADRDRAQKILEEAGLDPAWAIYTSGTRDGREEAIIADIVDRLVRYGSLSQKQTGFVHKLLRDIAARAGPDAERASAPVAQDDQGRARDAETVLNEAGIGAAWAVYRGVANEHREEQIIKDIVQRLVQYGNISEKQINFVGKLLRDIEGRAGAGAAKPTPETPHRTLPVGPVVIARKPRRR